MRLKRTQGDNLTKMKLFSSSSFLFPHLSSSTLFRSLSLSLYLIPIILSHPSSSFHCNDCQPSFFPSPFSSWFPLLASNLLRGRERMRKTERREKHWGREKREKREKRGKMEIEEEWKENRKVTLDCLLLCRKRMAKKETARKRKRGRKKDRKRWRNTQERNRRSEEEKKNGRKGKRKKKGKWPLVNTLSSVSSLSLLLFSFSPFLSLPLSLTWNKRRTEENEEEWKSNL